MHDLSLASKLKNFNGYPLRISFFWRYPTSMMLNELSKASQSSSLLKDSWRSNNFSGIDGILLASVVKAFNFTPILIKPDGAEFGYKISNGQFLGILLIKRNYINILLLFIIVKLRFYGNIMCQVQLVIFCLEERIYHWSDIL